MSLIPKQRGDRCPTNREYPHRKNNGRENDLCSERFLAAAGCYEPKVNGHKYPSRCGNIPYVC
jgi:hypothetical protein